MPAEDKTRMVSFYEKAFGWKLRSKMPQRVADEPSETLRCRLKPRSLGNSLSQPEA
jgi:hypothetical protein